MSGAVIAMFRARDANNAEHVSDSDFFEVLEADAPGMPGRHLLTYIFTICRWAAALSRPELLASPAV